MRFRKFRQSLCAGALIAGLCLGWAAPAAAESLWVDNSAVANMYSDRKARTVGDTLTIIISESASASRTGKASNSKKASASMKGSTGIFKLFSPAYDASASNSDSFQADGSLSNTNSVTARITAQVTEVKPNGNMVISGTHKVKQNGEEQRIIITGEVRVDDISADNTILSPSIANADIKIEGSGPISTKQRQGIITQILNFFF